MKYLRDIFLTLDLIMVLLILPSSGTKTLSHSNSGVLTKRSPMYRFPGATMKSQQDAKDPRTAPPRSQSPEPRGTSKTPIKEWTTQSTNAKSRSKKHPVTAEATLQGPAEIRVHEREAYSATDSRSEERHQIPLGETFKKEWSDPRKLKISGMVYPPDGRLLLASQGRKSYTRLAKQRDAQADTKFYSSKDGMVSQLADPRTVLKGSSFDIERPGTASTELRGGVQEEKERTWATHGASVHHVISNSPSHSPQRPDRRFPPQVPKTEP